MKYILFSLLLTLVLGCETKKTVPPSDPIVLATTIPLGKIGPYVYSGLAANLSDLVYQPLFYYRPDGEITYILAKELKWNKDKTRLKIFLKKPWAEDVVQSVKGFLQQDIESFAEGFKHLKEVRTLTPDLIEFELERYDRVFLYNLPFIRVIRSSQVDNSTGPFRLTKQDGEQIILERRIPSVTKVNKIIAKQIDSPRRVFRELVAGHVNVVLDSNQVDYEMIKNLPEIEIEVTDINLLYVLLENRKRHHSPLWKGANQHFPRENFLQTHNYDLFLKPAHLPMSEKQSMQYGIETFPPLPKDSFKPQPNSEPRILSFLTTNGADELLAKYIQRTLQSWGQHVILQPLKTEEYLSTVRQEKSFDLALVFWKISQPVATNYTTLHSHSIQKGFNFSSYANPLLDQLLDKARYAWKEEESQESFRLAMKYVLEDPPGIFLYWLQLSVLYRKNCSGFQINSYIFFLSLEDVRCEPSAVN